MDKRTPKEIEHDEIMLKVLNKLIEYVDQYTNVSVLKCQGAEADNMIACFCHLHQEDKIIIFSVDNDFIQLVNNNIYYIMIRNHCLITPDDVYDMKIKNKE